jgi:C1A family cysteine protease
MNNIFNHQYFTRYTLCTALLTLLLGLTSSTSADTTCQPSYTIGAELADLPCVDWLSDPTTRIVYKANLILEDADALLFKWGDKTPLSEPSDDVGAFFNASNNNLHIPSINVQTAPEVIQPYKVTLQENANGLLYIYAIETLPTAANNRPTATSFSLSLASADLVDKVYQQLQLKGKDEDNDTLAFELLATSAGTGYDLAYIDPTSHILYVVIKDQFFGTIQLPYRVSDGKTFSNPATVTLTVENVATDSSLKLGSQRVESREFAGYNTEIPDSRTYPATGSTDDTSTLPSRIDLSDKFPTPSDQGNQNSCVGWAIAYVKTYQEALEIGWSVANNDSERLFSPAFIYNQVNANSDYGSKISDALDLVVNKGAATLASMPYDSSFSAYLVQPTDAAKTEAENYKANNWGSLGSEDDMKAALANTQPVIVSMAVFDTLKNLKGTNSVYNTEGTYLGDHAVAIVGYDDDYEGGGAYKLINSWGTEWGDEGFFWLPYEFLSTTITIGGEDKGTLLAGAYLLLDKENATPSDWTAEEITANNLPNLVIMDWQIDYDPKRGGEGKLQYKIANTGVGTLPTNSTVLVDLILSKNPDLTVANYHDEFFYVVSEKIPASDLASGEAVARDENSAIEFTFESSIPAGTYYFYLAITGIDHDTGEFLDESSVKDNLKSSENSMTLLESELPNLTARFWFANWDREAEDGWLEYYIVNNSNTAIEADQNWYVSLVLFTNRDAQGNRLTTPLEYTIWRSEAVNDAFFPLESGQKPETQDYPFFLAPRDERGWFTIFADVDGNKVPAGKYEILFKLDGGARATGEDNKITESDETDNTSRARIFVKVMTGEGESIEPKPGEFIDEPPPNDPPPADPNDPPPADPNDPPPVDPNDPPPADPNDPPPVDPQPSNTKAPPPNQLTGGTMPNRRRSGDNVVRAYNCSPRFFDRCTTPIPQGHRRRAPDNGKVFAKTMRLKSRSIFPLEEIRYLPPPVEQ